jgi:hypothetical protein
MEEIQMNTEFNPIDKVNDLLDVCKEFNPIIRKRTNEGYDWLKDTDVCIEILNPGSNERVGNQSMNIPTSSAVAL